MEQPWNGLKESYGICFNVIHLILLNISFFNSIRLSTSISSFNTAALSPDEFPSLYPVQIVLRIFYFKMPRRLQSSPSSEPNFEIGEKEKSPGAKTFFFFFFFNCYFFLELRHSIFPAQIHKTSRLRSSLFRDGLRV